MCTLSVQNISVSFLRLRFPDSAWVKLIDHWCVCPSFCPWCSEQSCRFVVFFLLGDSPTSEFYMPTLWNTLSVPSS